MDTSQSAMMEGTAIIVPGQMAYLELPADVIRSAVEKNVEKIFPNLAHCSDADIIPGSSVAGGFGHRWEYGHDLLVDVPRTMLEGGPISALRQAGHILLTDLPTKQGIPIPGLSGQGIGHWLENTVGIREGYLSFHMADAGLGILVISEGSSDLIQAINGSLVMNGATFFDTFGEGGFEISLAIAAKNAWGLAAFNPAFVIVGGMENIVAGVISAYQTVSVYVDPLDFFGSAGTSALIGFGLAHGLAGESLSEASIDGIRSGAVGAFFSLSPAFGYGALAGFISFRLGRKLAQNHNSSMRALMTVDENAYQQLLEELCNGNIHLKEFLDSAEPHITLVDAATTLSTKSTLLNSSVLTLSDQFQQLDSNVQILSESTLQFKSNAKTLRDDSPILSDWYRTAFSPTTV